MRSGRAAQGEAAAHGGLVGGAVVSVPQLIELIEWIGLIEWIDLIELVGGANPPPSQASRWRTLSRFRGNDGLPGASRAFCAWAVRLADDSARRGKLRGASG